jgi:hypothetical protein
MREVTSFSLDEDVVRRLARLAGHLAMSRSRCLEHILNCRLPLAGDPLPARELILPVLDPRGRALEKRYERDPEGSEGTG